LDEVGIALDRLAERRFGFGQAVQRPENETERGTAIRPVGRECDRPLDMRERRRRLSGAERQDGKQMPGAGIWLVARGALATGRFRLGEPAGRLLGVGALEQLLERRLRALTPFLRQLPRFHAVILPIARIPAKWTPVRRQGYAPTIVVARAPQRYHETT